MAETVRLIDPRKILPNEENPRLIFREDELAALENSIKQQGILVPLTVFEDKKRFVILDGERRWRCALKLAMPNVPVIIQPKPDKLQNIMMMFAIHKSRSDWDPLPTAMKLDQLEKILTKHHGAPPSEEALAAAASISRGEVRRYRRILELPDRYKDELLEELEKPRPDQVLTVDHVLESVRGAESVRKRDIITSAEERELSSALIDKFRRKKIKSTVSPRQLPRIARAVQRGEIGRDIARRAIIKIIRDPEFTVENAFDQSVAQVDFEHSVEQIADRLRSRIEEHIQRKYAAGERLIASLKELSKVIRKLI
jgi:ParB/RepB/Spo0J family partition protein